jgi:DNA-binding transcriptional regulator PaaX
MRQSATFFILEKLAELGMLPLEVFLPRKYSYARIWRELFGLGKRHRNFQVTPRSFATIMGRLKHQGFIAVQGPRSRPTLTLTAAGKRYLDAKNAGQEELPKPDGRGRIVIFDIPEKEKLKRSWLRQELTERGFRKLQKSVWYGKRPLSESFFRGLDSLDLRPYVHIFEISKQGTLR